MNGRNLHSIVSEINLQAKNHPVGQLQEIRRKLKGLQRLPARDIFTSLTTFDKWAFHHGGRKELQFNIGFEDRKGIDVVRHGVAFSLETSQTLPSIDILIRKIKFFNDYIRLYLEKYADMRMWHYPKGVGRPSSDYMPAPIPPELATAGVFIFLGKRQPIDQIDYELLLNDLDRLLPLYKYVESNGQLQPISSLTVGPFRFRPGFVTKPQLVQTFQAQRELDITLRHNNMQGVLYRRLAEKYGAENVGTEIPSGVGTIIDLVVRLEGRFLFYEIKTANSPRACLREALGQLLEYAFWPGSQEAIRLIVVGETALDKEAAKYLQVLKKRFSLPLEYEQLIIEP